MRKAITDPVTIALIMLLGSIITVVFEKETDNSITNIIYQEDTKKEQCEQYYTNSLDD